MRRTYILFAPEPRPTLCICTNARRREEMEIRAAQLWRAEEALYVICAAGLNVGGFLEFSGAPSRVAEEIVFAANNKSHAALFARNC